MKLLPIQPEELYLSSHTEIVKGPVEEVERLGDDLEEGSQFLLAEED